MKTWKRILWLIEIILFGFAKLAEKHENMVSNTRKQVVTWFPGLAGTSDLRLKAIYLLLVGNVVATLIVFFYRWREGFLPASVSQFLVDTFGWVLITTVVGLQIMYREDFRSKGTPYLWSWVELTLIFLGLYWFAPATKFFLENIYSPERTLLDFNYMMSGVLMMYIILFTFIHWSIAWWLREKRRTKWAKDHSTTKSAPKKNKPPRKKAIKSAT